uniref:MADS-box protein n=1 Tax=Geum rupestre TaxID=148910 RepID=Q2XUP5_9ROSA|nr:MADS-box protein [Geum rupestre]
MGRGKVEIKRIENPTSRQVTYSKRRNGIIKKANELAVLVDAQVCLIMLSSTEKIVEYISPTTTVKKMIDLYQKNLKIDLWSEHYEAMKETLRKLKEVNTKLKREISQRTGQDQLNDLSLTELIDLEENMTTSVAVIRERKYHVIKQQTEKRQKKVRSLEERNRNLIHGYESAVEVDPQFGYVDNDGDFESAVALANGATNLYSFNRVQNNPDDPNLDNGHGGGSAMSSITQLHDLRLA